MGIHIKTDQGNIASRVLLPGDPMRARWIAEQFLEDVTCYNTIRGMYGYTGTYKGEKISVQGTGMGIPSFSIYFHELAVEYGIKKAIRIGTAGAIQGRVNINELILAQTASTDSSINKIRFKGLDFAPCGTYSLLKNADQLAAIRGMNTHVGNILTSDTFYEDPDRADNWKKWADFGVLAIEMESAALYTLGAKFGVDVLSILTVTDQLIRGEKISPELREQSLKDMVQLALDTIID